MNWRASLRLGELYVTQHHRERNADVVLMLDTLAEAGRAPETTLDWSVRAAASLATAYLARKDRVGLINYGGLIHWVKPAGGRAQYERLARCAGAGRRSSSPTWPRISRWCRRGCCRRGPSSSGSRRCSTRAFARAALDLAARGFDLVVLDVSPVAVTRAALAPSPATDLACRLWTLERHARIAELHRQGIPVLEWQPPEPLELALARARRRRPRLVAAG